MNINQNNISEILDKLESWKNSLQPSSYSLEEIAIACESFAKLCKAEIQQSKLDKASENGKF